MHGLLRCNINTGVQARSGRVTQRCHNSPRWQMGVSEKRVEDFGNLKKVRRVEIRDRTRRLTFAWSRRPWAGVARDWWGGWKSRNRKIVPLSYVEKPLNSKVIKSFVPEQRSRKCFSCFEIPMFYVIYIWTVYVYFRHIHIWVWYTNALLSTLRRNGSTW